MFLVSHAYQPLAIADCLADMETDFDVRFIALFGHQRVASSCRRLTHSDTNVVPDLHGRNLLVAACALRQHSANALRSVLAA